MFRKGLLIIFLTIHFYVIFNLTSLFAAFEFTGSFTKPGERALDFIPVFHWADRFPGFFRSRQAAVCFFSKEFRVNAGNLLTNRKRVSSLAVLNSFC
jgi:hypothetical protein